MNRLLKHLLFWCCYCVVNAFFEYTWVQENIHEWTTGKMIVRSVLAALVYVMVFACFTYSIIYYALNRLVDGRYKVVVNICIIILLYSATICMIVLAAHKFVLPYIYENYVVPTSILISPQRFAGIAVESAFPLGIMLAIKYVRNQQAAQQRETALVKEKLATELQLLKNQINPHFLFNTLNNIYALARKKSDQTAEVVLKLSELLHFTLYEASNPYVPIKREIQLLEDYIALEKVRYDSLSVIFNKAIDNEQEPIAPLLLLPLVENAFKHGASQSQFDSFIHIDLQLQKGQLLFSIKNSVEEVQPVVQNGKIGLANTNRQLELLYQQHSLSVNHTGTVFAVLLTINLFSYGKI